MSDQMPPITPADVARAADGLDRAHRFVKMARKTYLRLADGPGRDIAAAELARAEAGVAYAAAILRMQEVELSEEAA